MLSKNPEKFMAKNVCCKRLSINFPNLIQLEIRSIVQCYSLSIHFKIICFVNIVEILN